MRRVQLLIVVLLLSIAAFAATGVRQAAVQPFPKTLINAQYVYVTSYDGDQFDPRLLPEDRAAIANVQDAVQKWGRYTLVYRAQDADMILIVQSRPSEDVLAVYDAHIPGSSYMWRAMGREGLQKNETPLVSQLQRAVDQAGK